MPWAAGVASENGCTGYAVAGNGRSSPSRLKKLVLLSRN